MKWGFFSYGLIAPKIHESLKLIETEEVVAVASRSNHLELTQMFKNEITVYDNYESLCADPSIEIIYISSTHNFHYEHTMMCLRAGKHVICEKPLSSNAPSKLKFAVIIFISPISPAIILFLHSAIAGRYAIHNASIKKRPEL